MKISGDQLLIGAHTSTAGGVYNALLHGQAIGATTIQLFTSNQRQWKGRKLDEETIEKWLSALKETGLKKIMSHGSYLINLGTPQAENLEKSRQAFAEEVERCTLLGISYLNIHPGAALEEDPQLCLDRVSESLIQLEDPLSQGPTTLLLETTAGQGSSVGHTFEQLAYIIEKTNGRLPIGVCIDTCHIFAAGYDIRDEKGWDRTLKEFDRIIGLKYLKAFHVNDSSKDLGSRRDRHEQLGKGKIGIECFRVMMTDPRTRHVPKYLETPNPELWPEEIKLLREFTN